MPDSTAVVPVFVGQSELQPQRPKRLSRVRCVRLQQQATRSSNRGGGLRDARIISATSGVDRHDKNSEGSSAISREVEAVTDPTRTVRW